MISQAVKSIANNTIIGLLGGEDTPAVELLAARLPEMLLRVDTVCVIVGLSVPTIYRLMSHQKFPRPIRLTGHARAWRLTDVMGWIDTRAQERGGDAVEGSE
jgi:predicted DNA-binding transcriptional regulator AlpA